MDFPQAGGHKLMVKLYGKTVMKPTTSKEISFYIDAHPPLRSFIPTIYMACPLTYVISMFSQNKLAKITEKGYTDILFMENITKLEDEFILDIKLGKIHWVSSSSQNIIDNHVKRNKNSLTTTHRFRLDGAFIKNVLSLSKEDCRDFNIEQVNRVLSCLSDFTKKLLIDWIDKLINILEKLPISIYGPSILISGTNKDPRFTLIDFAVHDTDKDTTKGSDLIEGLVSFRNFLIS